MALRSLRRVLGLAAVASLLMVLSVTGPGVAAAAGNSVIASDSFARTVSNAWGAADAGGTWTLLDTAGWSVTPGAGSVNVGVTQQARAVLAGVAVQDVDLLAEMVLPLCTSSGTNCDGYVVGRSTGGSNPSYYRVGAVQGRGRATVFLRVQRSDGSNIGADVNTGIPAANGVVVWVRAEFQGVNPTVIRARVWAAGASEPASWQFTTSDSTSAEQTAGAVGVRVRNEDTSANRTFKFESFQATALSSSAPPMPTITGFTPTTGTANTAVTINGTNLTNASAVAFNGTPASYTVNSAAQISATVPAAASTGPITVTTPGGTATSTTNFTVPSTPPRSVTSGAFQVQWSLTDPEEITGLSWNGSPNLTNTWTNPGQCPGNPDLEFFGNAWGLGPAGVHPVAVGGGSTGTWSSQSAAGSTTVNIASAATSCPPQTSGIPVATTYQFPSSGNTFSVQRTFSFGTTPFTSDLRPYIPRLSPRNQYTNVYFPTTGGTIAQANEGACDPAGCEYTNWNGSWFALTNWATGGGVIVKRTSPPANVALFVDEDGGSGTSSTSVLLLQPPGGFTGTVTEAESLCFYQGWFPNPTLPAGC